MELKLNISDPKAKKSYKKVLSNEQSEVLYGLKLGDELDGSLIGYDGYKFKITGGSDICGFPMRKDIEGTVRKKILSVKTVGIRSKRKGMRLRKTVAGNTVYEKTTQLNLKVIEYGKKPLEENVKDKEAKN